jgi:DNA-binding LacI/PurR family transcriptional regulator
MRTYLQNRPPDQRPTTVIAGGDFMAAGIIKTLQDNGHQVPKDVSVMSIDGFNRATIGNIALTSVHLAREERGSEALTLLQRRMTRPQGPVYAMLIGGRLATGAPVKHLPGRRGANAVGEEARNLYG